MQIRTKEKSSCPHLELQSCVQFSKSVKNMSLEMGKTMNKLLLVSAILVAAIGFCEDGLQERILIEFTSTGLRVIEEEMGDAATKEMIQSANRGNADSQFKLGKCYYYGNGVEANFVEAAKWLRRSAEQGHAEAQWHLGMSYRRGNGVVQDVAEAAKWYRKAADQGHRYAIEELEELEGCNKNVSPEKKECT